MRGVDRPVHCRSLPPLGDCQNRQALQAPPRAVQADTRPNSREGSLPLSVVPIAVAPFSPAFQDYLKSRTCPNKEGQGRAI